METNLETNTASGNVPRETLNDTNHHHMGPVLGGMLIILVLILGGLYLWGSTLVDNTANEAVVTERIIPNNEPETPRAKADTRILETTSPSDELSSIEADLLSTNLDSLDSDLDLAERELDAALGAQ